MAGAPLPDQSITLQSLIYNEQDSELYWRFYKRKGTQSQEETNQTHEVTISAVSLIRELMLQGGHIERSLRMGQHSQRVTVSSLIILLEYSYPRQGHTDSFCMESS